MRILIVHNRYRTSAPSGEDIAVANEAQMLRSRGNEIRILDRCNDDLHVDSLRGQVRTGTNAIWSSQAHSDAQTAACDFQPDLVHVHNTFAALSPSIYSACSATGAALVQTFHNYRLLCPSALFMRKGQPCELCLTDGLHNAIRHRCYRNSLTATSAIVAGHMLHRALGTYHKHISHFVVLTEFARDKFIAAGFSPERISIKPNFLPSPPPPGMGLGNYAIYVGRLLEGKGTHTLLKAWRHLPDVPLKIFGDGALRSELEATATNYSLNVTFMGMQDRPTVLNAISNARLLILPSECYEGFPLVVAEAYACGTPIIASRIGSLAELVEDGQTGATFTPCDHLKLAETIKCLFHDNERLRAMRSNCRKYHDARLTEESNYDSLMTIYKSAVSHNRRPRESARQ